jgi:hypothetical protein
MNQGIFVALPFSALYPTNPCHEVTAAIAVALEAYKQSLQSDAAPAPSKSGPDVWTLAGRLERIA